MTQENKIEEVADEVTKDLQGGLQADKNMPFGVRLVILLVLMSGVAIIGNIFGDTFSATKIHLGVYLVRLIMGGILILSAYLLFKRYLLGIWLMGFVVLVGLMFNFLIGLIPLLIFGYLFYYRTFFNTTREYLLGKLTIKF